MVRKCLLLFSHYLHNIKALNHRFLLTWNLSRYCSEPWGIQHTSHCFVFVYSPKTQATLSFWVFRVFLFLLWIHQSRQTTDQTPDNCFKKPDHSHQNTNPAFMPAWSGIYLRSKRIEAPLLSCSHKLLSGLEPLSYIFQCQWLHLL